MAQPAIFEQHSFSAHRRTVSPNATLQRNRSTAGCRLAPAVDFTPAPVGHYILPGDREPALLNHRTGLI